MCVDTAWLCCLQARRVLLQGRPSLPYDVLSLNLGITPALSAVPGAAQHTTPVKPINGWVRLSCISWCILSQC